MHLVLVRHGRSSANSAGVLAGRAEGVHLDEVGRAQAESLVEKFQGAPITHIVGSPMVRCRETAEALCIDRRLGYTVREELNEVEYGLWSGRKLSELSEEPLWSAIQKRPTSVTFPGGEAMADLFERTTSFVEAMRSHAEEDVVVAFSHGDVIKAIISHAYAIPADEFQRIMVDPASVSILRLTLESTFVVRVNDAAITLEGILQRKSKEAVVGGENK